MAARKERHFLEELDSPSLEPGRRLALTLLCYVRDLELANDHVGEPVNFERDCLRLQNSLICVNCDNKIDVTAPFLTYCSDYCRQVARTIRYFRHARAQHREADADFQIGAGDKLLHLPNGGYPARDRLLSKEVREQIFRRDNYLCQICRKNPAQHVDHIRGSSCEPSNLQAACVDCNRSRAFSNLRPATPAEIEQMEELYVHMAERIAAPLPLFACDNESDWKKAESKIRAVRTKLVLYIELSSHGLREDDIQHFFMDVFRGCDWNDELSAAKHTTNVRCDSCAQLIPKKTLYILCSKHRKRTCLECVINYTEGDEDVDGYIAHTMRKDD